MHFGATLQLLRGHANLSLRDLAGRVGVSAAYLSRVEHGRDPPPSTDRVRSIARALDLGGDALVGLLDPVRPDAARWIGSSPTGRRLLGAMRRRDLTEAQLARVLAFVEQEFPLAHQPPDALVHPLLEPSRILLGVTVARVEDALALLALRLSKGEATNRLLEGLLGRGEGAMSAIGCGSLVAYARDGAPAPTAALLVLQAPLACATPDGRPLRVVWALAGVGHGPAGTALLSRVAHLAEDRFVDGVAAAGRVEEVLAVLRRCDLAAHR